jgi:hypothetical protein
MRKTNKPQLRQQGSKMLECMFCRVSTRCDQNTVSVLCGTCVANLTDAPAPPRQPVTDEARAERKAARAERKQQKAVAPKANCGRGRGWHLKKLFMWEGQAYSFGKPITAREATRLANA